MYIGQTTERQGRYDKLCFSPSRVQATTAQKEQGGQNTTIYEAGEETMRQKLIALILILTAILPLVACRESPYAKFNLSLVEIANSTPVPTYYDPISGDKLTNLSVRTPTTNFDTKTGEPVTTVIANTYWGFWDSPSMHRPAWAFLTYNGNYELRPYMLQHPENFYWVMTQ